MVVGAGMKVRWCGVACAVLAAATAAGAQPPASLLGKGPVGFSVAAACEIPPDRTDATGRPIGGLSGIVKTPATGEWLAVSDDQDQPRWYRLAIALDGPVCRVDVVETIDVRQPGVAPRASRRLRDAEGITILPDGRTFISTEGDGRSRPIIQPGVFEVDAKGGVVRRLSLPDRFAQRPGKTPTGVRDNAALEDLASTPDGRRVFTVTEDPLYQDGPEPTFGRGGLSRLIEYTDGPNGFAPTREFAVPLEPIRHPGAVGPEEANSGAVDILAIDPTTLLLLERGFVRGRNGDQRVIINDITLSRIHLDEADDVSHTSSLNAPLIRPVRKEVLLHLGDVASQLPAWLQGLDNFEGVAWGPTLPDGAASLVFVSDDNFSRRQHTAFVVLKVER